MSPAKDFINEEPSISLLLRIWRWIMKSRWVYGIIEWVWYIDDDIFQQYKDPEAVKTHPTSFVTVSSFFFLPVIFYSTIEMLYNSKKNMLSIEYFSLKFGIKKLVSDSQILFLSLLWMDHHGLLLLPHGLCLLWNQYSYQLVDHL